MAGFLLVMKPIIGAEVATIFMAAFFLIGGVFELVGSAAIQLPGWGWQVADGVITIALGLMVFAQWPASGLWVIGLLWGSIWFSTASPGSRSPPGFIRRERGVRAGKRSASMNLSFQPMTFEGAERAVAFAAGLAKALNGNC